MLKQVEIVFFFFLFSQSDETIEKNLFSCKQTHISYSDLLIQCGLFWLLPRWPHNKFSLNHIQTFFCTAQNQIILQNLNEQTRLCNV